MNYKIDLSNKALDDFDSIFDYIALDNKVKAKEFTDKIKQRIALLNVFPYSGRENETQEYREIIEYPYIIRYVINEQAKSIMVLHIRHGAQEEYRN
ncbi:MAG: type II toxin-antitoxin system RelE/ParE family toxin [Firmicutes bacterium]|nr:type II toxin-antitoxin system RelE/ParE family toxin [Bacillota bacterium]